MELAEACNTQLLLKSKPHQKALHNGSQLDAQGRLNSNHWCWSFWPLKMMVSRVDLPAALIDSKTETYSRLEPPFVIVLDLLEGPSTVSSVSGPI